MIPRRLRLHNFLSYQDCTIDFSPLHLAAISGANGHGKSALLDGITWGMWGRCRAGTDDEAIYLGRPEMFVDFEFEIEGDRFAVNRKKTRGKTAQLQLFHIDEDGGRAPITGSVMRETQADINRRVLFDHETFRNSVFVAQGHADEFTRKAPSERKKVLRSVLGLERYEDYSVRARNLGREREAELRTLRIRLDEGLHSLARLPEVKETIVQLEKDEQQATKTAAAAAEEVTALQSAASEFERRTTAVAEAQRDKRANEAALNTAKERLTEATQELQALEVAIKDKVVINEQHTALLAARAEELELASKQRETDAAKESARESELVVARETTALQSTTENLRKAIADHEKQAARLTELSILAVAQAKDRADLDEIAEEVKAVAATAAAHRERAAGRRAAAESAKTQAQTIKSKEGQLEGVALCPVCQSPLDKAQLDLVRQEYATERRALGEAYQAALATAASADAEAEKCDETAKSMEKQRRERDGELRAKEQSLAADTHRATTSAAALDEARTNLAQAEAKLEDGQFAEDARRLLHQAAMTIQRISYDAAQHETIRESVVRLAPVEKAFRDLETATGKVDGARELMNWAAAAAAERTVTLAATVSRLDNARQQLAVATDVSGPLQEARATLAGATDRSREVAFKRGQAEKERDDLSVLEAALEEARDRESALADETALYGDLATAFGRDGVQAMLIDQALPRMEVIANELLDTMTGGRIQLQLSTRRETKSGKVNETLDIRISDELGQRDYEMFSGGEAFRIDFALRIAMSQTLAERSGASLPTLIIDEGFGTQDRDGLDRLVDALMSIKDRFRLILLVTHIDELKQRFDRTIEVSKDDSTGSVAIVY